ncbi:hypothetical protein T12_17138 [Trichinella patagoniensis]|uniref:Uncharacterized protein n=1 Tax=Trichinella patagoniensis TaxID=990121 RepID=A0A0V0ZR33_9BILA|nr:hypothetical protein T12_17138 [Trichinella patagoniensis]
MTRMGPPQLVVACLELIQINFSQCCSIPNLKTMRSVRITSDKVYPTEKKSAMSTNNNQLQQYNIILSPGMQVLHR